MDGRKINTSIINDEDSLTDRSTENPIITINVGGTIIKTRIENLTKVYPDSSLALLFSMIDIKDKNQIDKTYFVDTDAIVFSMIIQYIRRGMNFDVVPSNIDSNVWKKEIDFWCLYNIEKKQSQLLVEQIDLETFYEKRITAEEIFRRTMIKQKIENDIPPFRVFIPHNVIKLPWGDYIHESLIKRCPFEFRRDGLLIKFIVNDTIVKHNNEIKYIFDNRTYSICNTITLQLVVNIEK